MKNPKVEYDCFEQPTKKQQAIQIEQLNKINDYFKKNIIPTMVETNIPSFQLNIFNTQLQTEFQLIVKAIPLETNKRVY